MDSVRMDLSPDEQKAIKKLKELEKLWPESLWLFSANGTLWIMRFNKDGSTKVKSNGSFDQEAIVTAVNIPNDGGDF